MASASSGAATINQVIANTAVTVTARQDGVAGTLALTVLDDAIARVEIRLPGGSSELGGPLAVPANSSSQLQLTSVLKAAASAMSPAAQFGVQRQTASPPLTAGGVSSRRLRCQQYLDRGL